MSCLCANAKRRAPVRPGDGSTSQASSRATHPLQTVTTPAFNIWDVEIAPPTPLADGETWVSEDSLLTVLFGLPLGTTQRGPMNDDGLERLFFRFLQPLRFAFPQPGDQRES